MTTCCDSLFPLLWLVFFFGVEKTILAKEILNEAFRVSYRRRGDYQVFGFLHETDSGASRAILFMLHQKPQGFHFFVNAPKRAYIKLKLYVLSL